MNPTDLLLCDPMVITMVSDALDRCRSRSGKRNRKKSITDFKSEKNPNPNPNPKDRGPTWGFLTAAASPPRGKKNVAPLMAGARDRTPSHATPRTHGHGNRAPPCDPSMAASMHAGERVRGGATSSSPSATVDGCCYGWFSMRR
jgi:hypothetical protein